METKRLQDLSFGALIGIVAKVIHSANRAYVDAIGGFTSNLSWEEIRESERLGLIHAITNMVKDPQTPQTSHERWCVAREADGWTKDVVYNYHRKTHPNLIPYDQLPFEEQFKDQLYMGIASIFCAGLGILEMDEVVAAREILEAKYAEEHKLVVDEDEEITEKSKVVDPGDDPVDRDSTIALREKIKAAQDEIEKLSGIPSDVRKDEEPERPRLNGVVVDKALIE